MALSAKRQTDQCIRRLKSAIKASGRSLREIAQMTRGLEAPEAVHHTNLSEILNRRPNSNLYLQTGLLLCRLIEVPPIILLADFHSAETAARAQTLIEAFAKLSAAKQHEILKMALGLTSDSAG